MQIAVSVVYLASIYVLLALGYVVVYRASRVLNLAHGEIMALGGYLLLSVGAFVVGGPLLAGVVVLLLSIGVGLVIYRFAMRPLSGYPTVIQVLMTVAVLFLLQGLISFFWTTSQRRPSVELDITVHRLTFFELATFTSTQLAMVVAAAVVYVALLVAARRSQIGIQMRGVAENPRLAAHRGIRITHIYAIAWALAACLAAVVGMLHGVGVFLTPSVGLLGLKAFPVALIGGLDSLEGVLPAAILVALAEQLTIIFVSPILGEVMPYILMMVVLVVRPWGMFGTKQELERI